MPRQAAHSAQGSVRISRINGKKKGESNDKNMFGMSLEQTKSMKGHIQLFPSSAMFYGSKARLKGGKK